MNPLKPKLMKLKFLVLHCTATVDGQKVTSDDIRRWHLSPKPAGRGWKQVGYEKMFHLDGTVEQLVENNDDDFVDGWEITNGAVGINSISRHWVYVGGLSRVNKAPKDTRTAEQLESLKTQINAFIAKHPRILIAGHNQFAAKACPSFDVPKWLTSIGVPITNIYQP